GAGYFRCFETSLVISNMLTCALPPKTAFSAGSALIMRLFFWSWSPFFLMYRQSALVASVRGRGLEPTTAASSALGVGRFLSAAWGLGADFFFAPPALRRTVLALFAAVFFAAFFTLFFALFLAICSPLETPCGSTHHGGTRVPRLSARRPASLLYAREGLV